jgi:hypothetical protein
MSATAAASVSGFGFGAYPGFALLDAAPQFVLLAFAKFHHVLRPTGQFLSKLALGYVPTPFDQ